MTKLARSDVTEHLFCTKDSMKIQSRREATTDVIKYLTCLKRTWINGLPARLLDVTGLYHTNNPLGKELGFSFTGCLSVMSLVFCGYISLETEVKTYQFSLLPGWCFLPGRRSCHNWTQKYSSSQFSMIQRFRSEGSYFRPVSVMGALGLSSRFNVIRKLRVCRYQEVHSCFFLQGKTFNYNCSYHILRKENSLALPRNFVSTLLRESFFITTQYLKRKKDNL